MLKPTGFWSYSVPDDSNGGVSRLRKLLANELQLHVGREKVSIFQDRASIQPGDDWESRIVEALKDVSFFIPVLTKGFLQSSWCCREVTEFRRLRGRNDLVFPIHYADVGDDDSGGSIECADGEVLKFLRTRQWVDFRMLRFERDDSREVSQEIYKMAVAIGNSLNKKGTEVRSTSPETISLAEAPCVEAVRAPAETPTTAVLSPPREVGALPPESLDELYAILGVEFLIAPKPLIDEESQGVTSSHELAKRLEERLSRLRSLKPEKRVKLRNRIRDWAEKYEPGRGRQARLSS
jgi:TIR domain